MGRHFRNERKVGERRCDQQKKQHSLVKSYRQNCFILCSTLWTSDDINKIYQFFTGCLKLSAHAQAHTLSHTLAKLSRNNSYQKGSDCEQSHFSSLCLTVHFCWHLHKYIVDFVHPVPVWFRQAECFAGECICPKGIFRKSWGCSHTLRSIYGTETLFFQ